MALHLLSYVHVFESVQSYVVVGDTIIMKNNLNSCGSALAEDKMSRIYRLPFAVNFMLNLSNILPLPPQES